MASWILEKLAKLTGKAKWRDLADRQFSFLAQSISSYPAGYAFSLTAMGEAMYPSKELICVSNQREEAVSYTHLDVYKRQNKVRLGIWRK